MKNKIIIGAVIAVAITIIGVVALKPNSSSSSNAGNGHTHEYEASKVVMPTCTEQGYTTYTCNCGHSYKDDYTNAYTANEIYESSKNSVGEITTYDKNGNEYSLGTGFVYSANGKIITNYHVMDGAYSAKINIAGVSYKVEKILAYDKNLDIVVFQILANKLQVMTFCDKSHAVGKGVYAIGSSRGLTDTFSQGIITYADRDIDGVHYVQHNAAISSGNSGGPLINDCCEVIGINTMTVKDSQNLNFAVSITELSKLKYGTPLTVAQFYQKECDPFEKIKNYVKEKGTYDYENKHYSYIIHSSYSDGTRIEITINYDVADNEIVIYNFVSGSMSSLLGIYIKSDVSGSYSYIYNDSHDYIMMGTLDATTFDSYTLVGYTYNNVSSSSLRTTLRELVSSMVNILGKALDSGLEPMGLTAEDLGFLCY